MPPSIFSAPNEQYLTHIELCREKYEIVFPLFLHPIKRILGYTDEKILYNSFLKMICFHDLGKLTKRWQENLGKNAKVSHAPIGAAFLFKILPTGLREPISFAIAIHHTDKGLLGDNIERPDVQAVLEGIVDFDGNIIWHKDAYKLESDWFPGEAKNLTIHELKEMARGLRIWAKGGGLLEQHQRRLQASLAHHILKLCDISAAGERKDYQKKDDEDYYGGWLMVEEIKRYVENKKLLMGGINE
ncbi:MAG: hypothetical protein ABIN61_05240 [candidate division WOR-3 bacterium]